MEVVFECGWCGAENFFVARQVGFFGDRWELPSDWHCHDCDELNDTPDPPWT